MSKLDGSEKMLPLLPVPPADEDILKPTPTAPPVGGSGPRVRSTRPIKLKDKSGRNYISLDLEKLFWFRPERIIIQKVQGETNRFIVHAVLTPEEIEKEDVRLAEAAKTIEAVEAAQGVQSLPIEEIDVLVPPVGVEVKE